MRISMCHCLACQRRTGSAFGVQARFPKERVRIEGCSKEYVRISDEGEERVRAAYGPETYRRLVALKDKYDPANLFRLNQNIKPSGAA